MKKQNLVVLTGFMITMDKNAIFVTGSGLLLCLGIISLFECGVVPHIVFHVVAYVFAENTDIVIAGLGMISKYVLWYHILLLKICKCCYCYRPVYDLQG